MKRPSVPKGADIFMADVWTRARVLDILAYPRGESKRICCDLVYVNVLGSPRWLHQ